MSVHGSELKCKYLIKVNPGQVNKPGTQRQRKKYGGSERGHVEEGEEKRDIHSGPKGCFLLPLFIS